MLPGKALTEPYYRTAIAALHFLDDRNGRRRFGPDADARWHNFAGEGPTSRQGGARARILSVADRIDLLIRDADIQWSGAFAARTVFDLTEVAEDDAFGHAWGPFEDAVATWHQVTLTPHIPDIAGLLSRISIFWKTPLRPADPLPPLSPQSRWLLLGPSAVASAILAFAAAPGAVWHDQVIVVAGSPLAAGLSLQQQQVRGLTRQLAAIAAGLLAQPRPTTILSRPPAADEHRDHVRLGSPEEDA